MIPIRIEEATNPSNIGAYKNTPFEHPVAPRKHTKPVKGSYKNWIESTLTESKRVILEGTNLSEEELIQSIISAITQNDKYFYISYWIDNEVDNGEDLEANSKELYNLIKLRLLPIAEKYYAAKPENATPTELCKLWKEELSNLNDSLKQQYGELM